MTGEELNRRYHELCGWVLVGSRWRPADGGRINNILPPLHLNANLAIAEADLVFVEWIYTAVPESGRYRVNAYWERNPDTGFYKSLEVHGDTFCEAILKALIAAKEPK